MKAALKDFSGELDGHIARKITPSEYKIQLQKAKEAEELPPPDHDERLQQILGK